jgi:nitrate/nitrite transport system substrate-binding protein
MRPLFRSVHGGETVPMCSLPTVRPMDRRQFLKASALVGGVVAGGGLLNACGTSSGDSTTTGTGGGGKDAVKLGFIALTDCAPLIIAKERGFFAERGLDVTLEKQASWPATRDALLNNQIDGAHCLFSMPLSVATNIGGQGSKALKIAMVLNNNGQAITLANDLADAGYGDLAKAKAAFEKKGAASLGMTFPGGTHDTWLRYWLKAAKIDTANLKIDPIPPPQMVQNMKVGNVSGYCVGEPWNAVAVKENIGFTHIATQDIWEFHPEKALVVGEKFAAERKDVLKRVMAATLQACKWLDDPANRAEAAKIIGVNAYVNAPAEEIQGRLTGQYNLGANLGSKTFEGTQMQFFRDGKVTMPRPAHAIWFLAQYQRFGLAKSAPDYKAIVDSIILGDLYAEVAKAEGIALPDDAMKPFDVKLDNITFDPAKPDQEASRT